MLEVYQDPKKLHDDPYISEVKAQIERIHLKLEQNIDDLLQNDETLDELIDMAEDLDMQSKAMYKKTKVLRKWCPTCIVM